MGLLGTVDRGGEEEEETRRREDGAAGEIIQPNTEVRDNYVFFPNSFAVGLQALPWALPRAVQG